MVINKRDIKKSLRSGFSSVKFNLTNFFRKFYRKIIIGKVFLFFKRLFTVSKILKTWEKRLVTFLLLVFVLGLIFFVREKYLARTSEVPDFGGVYVEGVVGEPSQINPIFATSDIDRAITRLVFRGLTKLGPDKNIVGDIAKFKVSLDGLKYTFTIRDNVAWHDGEKVISDDMLFTVSLLQDPEYQGPHAGIWDSVSLKKISDKKFEIHLTDPYAPFLESTLIGILPSHILGGLSIEDIRESEFSANPIGCGPYKIMRSLSPKETKIKFLTLKRNEDFYEKDLKIEKITFNFYKNWKEAVLAFEKGEVTGIANLTPDKQKYFTTTKDLVTHEFQIPQFMAMFFNTKKVPLNNGRVRLAISHAVDKKNIFAVFGGSGKIIESPILPGMTGYRALTDYKYSKDKASELLEGEGYKKNNDGFFERNGDLLAIQLITVDNPLNDDIAKAIRSQLESIGVIARIKTLPLSNLQQEHIIARDYDLLLIGENLGLDPDPYPFWHSSQVSGDGINLSQITDSQIDNLLEDARKTVSKSGRAAKYRKFVELLHQKVAAVFLYQPNYVFGTNRAVRGVKKHWLISDCDRFFFIDEWYIKTKRVGN